MITEETHVNAGSPSFKQVSLPLREEQAQAEAQAEAQVQVQVQAPAPGQGPSQGLGQALGGPVHSPSPALAFPAPLTPFLHRNPYFRLHRTASQESIRRSHENVTVTDTTDDYYDPHSPPRSRPATPTRTPSRKSHERTHWLAPRKRFVGYQISGYKKFQVTITIQSVSLPNNNESNCTSPHLTGFLSIKGLTVQNPEITTFFESITVTDSLGFLSKDIPIDYDSYKATDQTDLEHWLNFPSFKELCMQNDPKNPSKNILQSIIDGTYAHTDYLNQRFLYMRWNEKFLVPDADLESIDGASYDGYYYIVHDQLLGNILGFYYHQHAERFQQLELQPLVEPSIGDCSFEFA